MRACMLFYLGTEKEAVAQQLVLSGCGCAQLLISTLRRIGGRDPGFEASLGYRVRLLSQKLTSQ